MASPTLYDDVYRVGRRGFKRLGNYANPMNPAKNLYQAVQYVNPLGAKLFAAKSPMTLKIEETREILKGNVESLMNVLQAQYPDRVAGYLQSNTKKNLTAEVRNLQRQKKDLTDLLKPKSNRETRSMAKTVTKSATKAKSPKASPKATKSKTKSKTPSPKATPKKRTPKRKNSTNSNWNA
jgi:hypothetical protein